MGQEQEESMVAEETDQHHEDFQGNVHVNNRIVSFKIIKFHIPHSKFSPLKLSLGPLTLPPASSPYEYVVISPVPPVRLIWEK